MSCNNLPFPRGETYFNGVNIDSNEASHLEGREYCVTDNQNGTGAEVRLRVVRATSDLALSNAANRYRGVRFGATATWTGRKVRGFTAALGEFGLPIDDAYVCDIKSGDLFYVVVSGPCKVRAGSSTTGAPAISANDNVCFTTAGRIQAGGAGRVPFGMIDTAVSAGATGNAAIKLVWVGGPFADIE
jgi:hypothetical protein